MTSDEIIRMAREAGIHMGGHPMNPLDVYVDDLERFAALIAQAEREACAQMVDHILKEGGGSYGAAIRARSKA